MLFNSPFAADEVLIIKSLTHIDFNAMIEVRYEVFFLFDCILDDWFFIKLCHISRYWFNFQTYHNFSAKKFGALSKSPFILLDHKSHNLIFNYNT